MALVTGGFKALLVSKPPPLWENRRPGFPKVAAAIMNSRQYDLNLFLRAHSPPLAAQKKPVFEPSLPAAGSFIFFRRNLHHLPRGEPVKFGPDDPGGLEGSGALGKGQAGASETGCQRPGRIGDFPGAIQAPPAGLESRGRLRKKLVRWSCSFRASSKPSCTNTFRYSGSKSR